MGIPIRIYMISNLLVEFNIEDGSGLHQVTVGKVQLDSTLVIKILIVFLKPCYVTLKIHHFFNIGVWYAI